MKLVSSYASHQARLTFLSPSVRLPKQLSSASQALTSCSRLAPKAQPRLKTSLRPSPSAHLLACLTGTTSSLVRLPGQQPTHGFAASWLRLASGPAQSLPSPGPSASQGTPATTGPQLPAHQQAQPSVPRSGLSNVSETGLRPTTSLTCLRLVSSYASYSAARPFRRSLRLVSRYATLRLASDPVPQPACWRVLRVCDWPQAQPSQQLATQPQPIPSQPKFQAQPTP